MWFLYALLGAFGKAYSGLFKKKMAGNVAASTYMWVAYTLILLVMTPFMFAKMPDITDMFVYAPLLVAGAALTNILATQLNLEALKREELSYTAPLNAFVPIFTLIIAALFLNESPPKFGIVGIVIIFIGAYIVSLKASRVHWYDPLVRLTTSAGAQLSLLVALSYAINTVLMKQLSNQGYDSFSIMYAITLFGWLLLVYVPVVKRIELKIAFRSNGFIVAGAAISSFASSFFHILAVANTYTSYATSVRRFDAIISVLLGWRYLKESNIRNKLIGSICMVIGAIAIALS